VGKLVTKRCKVGEHTGSCLRETGGLAVEGVWELENGPWTFERLGIR
jgi:hypothetical protein